MPNLITSENWYKHPAKRHVVLVLGLWVLSMLLLSAAATDFFSEPAKARNHAVFLLLLVLPATWSLVGIVVNYRSQRSV